MADKEQQRRERAYKIWEDEGRPDGAHADHWKCAERPDDLADQESDDVTKVNEQADYEFASEGDEPENAAGIRPPSTVAPV